MRSLVFIVFIISAYSSLILAKFRHEKSRNKRQEGWEPSSWVWEDDDGGGGGDWGPWTLPSSCSRPCGGGVSSQNRTCRSNNCWGSARRFFSCNIQDCSDSRDFREEQCAEYNQIPYEGIHYDWIPYTRSPNKCALNCMPRGERFYYKHKDKVIDGTRCDDESLDVCVDGKCKPVGCDKMLGSNKREDKCRVCGGDGSSCDTKQDTITSNDFKVGYNDLFMVPAGATNIRVKEVQPSNNYLAVRNASNHYYLNGDWKIDYPRILRFAGTTFHYGRKPHGFFAPESITAQGPTTEILFIVLLYQERNPGVEYEYSLPKGSVHQTDPEGYSWLTDVFSECSATCGGGYQSRRVWCGRIRDSTEVSSDLCDANLEPSSNQGCSMETCPASWHTAEWAPCSVSCGIGTQGRQVQCVEKHASGQMTVLNDSHCIEVIGEKPNQTQPCGDDGPCPIWHIGLWKPCDALCGDGKQRRVIQCYRREEGKIVPLPESMCGPLKPEMEKPCNLRPCEGVDWVTSEWSGCEDKCGLAFETREAMCASKDGTIYPDNLCHEYRKPDLVRNCTVTSCASQWYASQWSTCSSKCGPGVQTRSVFCATFENDSLKKVDDGQCDETLKYSDQQPCVGEGECKGEWFSGPYGECSKPCGGGQRSRKLLCFKDNQTVHHSECSSDSTFFDTSPCNTHPCGEDEIIPVEADGTVMEEDSEECIDSSEDDDYEDDDDDDESSLEEERDVEKIDITDKIDVRFGDKKPVKLEEDEEGSGEGSTTSFSGSTTEETSSFSTASEGLSKEMSSESTEVLTSPSTETSYSTSMSPPFTSLDSEADTDSTSSGSSESKDTTDIDSSTMVTLTSDVSQKGSSATQSTSGGASSTMSSPSSDNDLSSVDATIQTSTPTPTDLTTDSTKTTQSSSEISSESSSESSSWATTVMTSLMSMMTSEETTKTVSSTILSTMLSDDASSGDSTFSSESSSETTVSYSGDLTTTSKEETSEETPSSVTILSTDLSAATESSEITVDSTSIKSTSDTTFESSSPVSALSTDLSTLTTDATGISSTSVSYDGSSSTTSWSETVFGVTIVDGVVTREQTPRKCKKKVSKCVKSEFGCCPDNKTPAKGPFAKDCPMPRTCKESKYGCCDDGVSPALGPKLKGCPPSMCNETLFGCCPNGVDVAMGNEYEGCPEQTTITMDCKTSEFGCCPDGILSATGPKFAGCFECEGSVTCETCNDTKYGCCPDGISQALGPDFVGCDIEMSTEMFNFTMAGECENSSYGCCPDGLISAMGENFEGCQVVPCEQTKFGCCPDGNSTSRGPSFEGCESICSTGTFGCCDDNVTLSHGPNKEGCCLTTSFGCCYDNIQPALGPNYYGCRCDYSPYGCCPDGSTVAKGPDNEGCGCQYTPHKCCPDKVTPAAGPNYEGCPCHSYQFGCCPDGINHALGPRQQGCGCENSKFGCCGDSVTPAPEEGNCTCDASKFGCCLDGEAEALGDKFEGCAEKTKRPGDVCALPKDRGPCREFAVKWHYDTKYGGCSRFWYGSCEGNGNRFNTQEECKAFCVEPPGRDACELPKIEGPCKGYYPRWHYDSDRKQCRQFIYGGCLGNNNKFNSQEDCEELCLIPDTLDACNQELDEGPCKGNFTRWYFNKESHTCYPFRFGGCQGNKNNFHTEEACTAKCLPPNKLKGECTFEKSEGEGYQKLPRWHFSVSENRCMPFYFRGSNGNENNFDYIEYCEQECPSVKEKDVCALPALEGECHNFTIRFYFDSIDSRCKQFYYGGCGGNSNNFISETDCLSRCDPSAPYLPPSFSTEMCFLPSDTGSCSDYQEKWFYDSRDGVCKSFNYGGCRGNGNSFSSPEECEHNCGNVQDVCSLPQVEGPCDSYVSAWYYDHSLDSCTQFTYSGCQGNNNRFITKEECERRCRSSPEPQAPVTPPAHYLPDICWSPVDPGPCLQQVISWFYDSSIGRCQQFKYGGCEGNANRFASEEQCERQCGQFRRHDTCSEGKDVGSCDQQLRKWYYDGYKCVEFMYSGCGGNTNRYSSEEECLSICEEKKEPPITPGENTVLAQQAICKLPSEPGSCNNYIKRYHYDASRGTCLTFIFTGCSANLNNFGTYQQCMSYCSPHTLQPNEIDIDKDDCWENEQECNSLVRCPYGIARRVNDRGCDICSCHDPCDGYDCSPGNECIVEKQTNPITQLQEYVPICRSTTKAGTCPEITDGSCEEECSSDRDCLNSEKCCYNGCGTSCTHPYFDYFTTKAPEQHSGVEPPEIITDEEDTEVVAEEGNYATLKCVVRGSPVPTISWRKDGIMVNSTGSKYRQLQDGTLQVIGLIRDDSGIYICIAENGIGRSVQKEFHLKVKDGVDREASILGEDNAAIVVSLGTPAVLQCYAVGWPKPSITWWRGSRMLPLHSAELEQSRDNSLVLHSVTLSNLGSYTCQAYNGLKSATSWTVVLKAIGPVYSADPNDVTYNQFLVPLPWGPPDDRPRPPSYVPRPPPPVATTRPPPLLPPPTRRVYSVPVRVEVSAEKDELTPGQDISIGCNVEGFPTPTIVWYKDNIPIQKSDRVSISEVNRLIISQAIVDDTGTYKCKAGNAYGDSEDSAYINVKAGAYIPSDCTDNPFFANCALIVQADYCSHEYYANFCCKSCTEAGLINHGGTRKRRSIPRQLVKLPLLKLLKNKVPLLPHDM